MTFPKRIGHYEIIAELGQGGMATVYHAHDPKFNRDVAIKVLPRILRHDPQFRARFEREIKTLAALEHPCIVPVYDAGEEDEQTYFVMRYMPGGSLADRMRREKISLQDSARILGEVAHGLAYAHQKGFIHRDIKPDNVLFDAEGNACVSDFGIAKLAGATGKMTEQKPIGTATYMSPEQVRGEKLDPRSDIYNLGVLLFHLLTGKLPYMAEDSFSIAYKHLNDPVPEILHVAPNLPPETDRLIKTSMAKDKNRRYADALAFAKELHLVAFGKEENFSLPVPRRAISPRNILISTAILLGVLITGVFLLRQQLLTPAAPKVIFMQSAAPKPASTQTAPPAPTITQPPAPTSAPEQAVTTMAVAETASPIALAPTCATPPFIATPVIKDIDKFCVEANPYTTLSIPEGATFESLDPAFTCKVEYTRAGRNALSCTGKSSYSFQLKVCPPPAQTDSEKTCPNGLQFDPANQCCATPPTDAGCRIYKVETRACQ